jgi:multicomponent K+:H+ antiporter subunit D
VWAVVLGGALLVVIALSRAGSRLFWKTREPVPAADGPRLASPWQLVPVAALLTAGALVSLLGGHLLRYTDSAAAQLLEPSRYIESVLTQPPIPAPGDGS